MKHISTIIIIILLIGIGTIITICLYLGPKVPSHAKLGYYAKNRPKVINISRDYETLGAHKVYLKKNDIQWNKGIYIHNNVYYFPKKMPRYTREYVIRKSIRDHKY